MKWLSNKIDVQKISRFTSVLNRIVHKAWVKFLLILGFVTLCTLEFISLPETLHNQPYSRVLFSKSGQLIASKIATDSQWRFPPPEQLPEKYERALVTFEDKRFYYHPGVDAIAVTRAAISNLQSGRIVSGGSTLTMQLARMLRGDPPRNLKNKFIELLLALQLEWHYDKNQLLNLYASYAPFGGNIVGLNTASWRYFERYPNDLSWSEAALLAVLPNSPGLIHPGRGRKLLQDKRDRLLHKLHDAGYLNHTDLKLSLLEPLPGKPKATTKLGQHLLQTAIHNNPEILSFHSTIDLPLQNKLVHLSQIQGRRLSRAGINNLSIVVMDNRTQELVGYIGNASVTNVARSVDIATKPRSTGSILKPFLYAAMLQNGDILPNMLVADTPTNYKGFTPENFDRQFRGAVPVKQALAQSLNIPFVRMLQSYGVSRFHGDLETLGMSTLFRPSDDYGLSLILGGAEGNLFEITAMYARLMASARGDKETATNPVRWLIDSESPVSFLSQKSQFQPFDSGVAWLTLDSMLDVTRPGMDRKWRDYINAQNIAWKTGTSYGLRDAWSVGSNNHYTVGVWAGNAGGEGVAGLSGLNSAAPVMFEVFQRLPHSNWLARPDADLKPLETCKVDGHLSGGLCDAELTYAPKNSHFKTLTPFHKTIQLDENEEFRVHGNCESVAAMTQHQWFVLPPLQEYYWRQQHSDYRPLPPWRKDCINELAEITNQAPMDIVYPHEGSKIYIPTELSGKKGRAIFKATHRNSEGQIHWHLDNEFLVTTKLFHEVEIEANPGWHKLILIDDRGFRMERLFRVLNKEQTN